MKTVLEHLHERHFDTSVHTAWIDEEQRLVKFPLWNLSGKLVGYQQYRPEGSKEKFNNPLEGRYFTRSKNETWSVTLQLPNGEIETLRPKRHTSVRVWGLESWNFSNTLFLTEGIFDACRLTELGYSACAMLANDLDSSTRNWLYSVKANRPVVSVCDNDAAGKKLAKYGHASHIVECGDLGDASEEYVMNLAKEYSEM